MWSCCSVLLLERFVVWFTVSFSIKIVSIVTRLQTGQLRVVILALARDSSLLRSMQSAVEPYCLLLNADQCSFPQSWHGIDPSPESCAAVKMYGPIFLLLLYALMYGTTLPLLYCVSIVLHVLCSL